MDHLWLATIRAGAGCGQAEMEVMLTLPCFGRVWFMLRPGQAKTMTQDQDQENAHGKGRDPNAAFDANSFHLQSPQGPLLPPIGLKMGPPSSTVVAFLK